MISPETVRRWYTPVEVSTLRRWLLVSVVVNVMLLSVDVLRGGESFFIGVLGVLMMGALLNSLPQEQKPASRNQSLMLGGAVLLCGLVRLLETPMSLFDCWMHAWMVGPGALTILWVSGRPVSAWSTRSLSIGAVEYGLARNQSLAPRFQAFGAHLVLLHFVVLTLLPLVWILDIALSPGNALGGSLGGPYTTEHFSNMLGSDAFWTWMRNSLIVSIGTTLLGLVVAIPAGYAFQPLQVHRQGRVHVCVLAGANVPRHHHPRAVLLGDEIARPVEFSLGPHPCLLCHGPPAVRVDVERLL